MSFASGGLEDGKTISASKISYIKKTILKIILNQQKGKQSNFELLFFMVTKLTETALFGLFVH
jgi:hypothetical protein